MGVPGFNASLASIGVLEGNGRGISGTSASETFDLRGISLITGSGMGFVDAGAGNDSIIGTLFADDLRGGAGTDILTGGLGNDTLAGGADADIFKFVSGFGKDLITDFTAGAAKGHDVLDFTGVFADFNAMKSGAVQSGKDTLISAGSDTLALKNVAIGGLLAVDFAFH